MNDNQTETIIINYYEKLAAETKMLKKTEEFDLLDKCINHKCQESREKLITAYLKVVVSLSRKYAKNNNLSRADLIHAGIIGIGRALETFDLSMYKTINKTGGSLWGFFCYRAILKELWNFYRENIRQFSVSDTSNTRLNNINKLYKQGKFNDLDENEIQNMIGEKLKLKKSETKLLLNLFKKSVELDKPIENLGNDGLIDSLTLQNEFGYYSRPESDGKDTVLNNGLNFTPYSHLEEKEKFDNLLRSLDELPEKERSIIYNRYGINCQKHTLSGLAKKYNVSSTKIMSHLDKIHGKLKCLVESKS
jgi:RNA polymerase sigma factor (sigma-70 family)